MKQEPSPELQKAVEEAKAYQKERQSSTKEPAQEGLAERLDNIEADMAAIADEISKMVPNVGSAKSKEDNVDTFLTGMSKMVDIQNKIEERVERRREAALSELQGLADLHAPLDDAEDVPAAGPVTLEDKLLNMFVDSMQKGQGQTTTSDVSDGWQAAPASSPPLSSQSPRKMTEISLDEAQIKQFEANVPLPIKTQIQKGRMDFEAASKLLDNQCRERNIPLINIDSKKRLFEQIKGKSDKPTV